MDPSLEKLEVIYFLSVSVFILRHCGWTALQRCRANVAVCVYVEHMEMNDANEIQETQSAQDTKDTQPVFLCRQFKIIYPNNCVI